MDELDFVARHRMMQDLSEESRRHREPVFEEAGLVGLSFLSKGAVAGTAFPGCQNQLPGVTEIRDPLGPYFDGSISDCSEGIVGRHHQHSIESRHLRTVAPVILSLRATAWLAIPWGQRGTAQDRKPNAGRSSVGGPTAPISHAPRGSKPADSWSVLLACDEQAKTFSIVHHICETSHCGPLTLALYEFVRMCGEFRVSAPAQFV